MENRSIALDGPVGAGKTTLARRAAKHFGIIHVDTGALYRCVALFAMKNSCSFNDEASIKSLLPQIYIEMKYDSEGVQRMILNGEDVTDDIRLPDVSMGASDVSAMPAVRDFLLDTQRNMAKKYDVIMDGRDIGTVVLPNAGLKVFLHAAPEIRAKRRYDELLEKNVKTTFEEVLNDLNTRDKNDSERKIAPLKAADDAIKLDTSELNLEESVEALCKLIAGRVV
jgi:cytidylate kinase